MSSNECRNKRMKWMKWMECEWNVWAQCVPRLVKLARRKGGQIWITRAKNINSTYSTQCLTTRPPLEHWRADLSWSKVKKQIQVTERHFFEHLFRQVRRDSGHSRELQLRRRASFISGRGRQKLRHVVIPVSLNVRVITHHNASLSFSAVILWAANCHVLSEPNNVFIMQLLNCWVALFIKITVSCVWWMSFTGFGYRTV